MSKYLSAEDFLKGVLGEEEDAEIEGLGTIRIRPVGMAEALRISAASKDDGERFVGLLQAAIVEPKFTPEQVEKLYRAMSVKIQPLLDRIEIMAGQKGEVTDPLVGNGS